MTRGSRSVQPPTSARAKPKPRDRRTCTPDHTIVPPVSYGAGPLSCTCVRAARSSHAAGAAAGTTAGVLGGGVGSAAVVFRVGTSRVSVLKNRGAFFGRAAGGEEGAAGDGAAGAGVAATVGDDDEPSDEDDDCRFSPAGFGGAVSPPQKNREGDGQLMISELEGENKLGGGECAGGGGRHVRQRGGEGREGKA